MRSKSLRLEPLLGTATMRAIVLLVAALAATAVAQKDPHWVDGHNTIVQMFEWKFSDIAAECERFLGPKGYGGVQTSPVNECPQLANNDPPRPWWERYQPLSYKIIGRSGNEQQFADMVRRCNNVGVRVYVDIVVNHMTGNVWNPQGYGGSTADPQNLYYPAVPYTAENFHAPCDITDYLNATDVRDCELSSLHDLDQSQDYVRQKIIEFLDRLVDHGVAGFRMDASKHMWPADLGYIFSKVKDLSTEFFPSNTRPFFYQEVPIPDPENEAVHTTDYINNGVVTEFLYGIKLSNCFEGNDPIHWLGSWGPSWGLLESDSALAFIDNHDTQRNGNVLNYKTPKLYKMAIAFMLAWPYGTTRITSSYDFNSYDVGPPVDNNGNILDVTINSDETCGNGWICEHRWRQIVNMIGFKNTVRGTQVTNWWDNGNQLIAFCRGNRGFIAFNDQYNTNLQQWLQTCLPEGTYCDLISGSKYNGSCSGKSVRVNSDGTAYIEILSSDDDGVLALSLDSKL